MLSFPGPNIATGLKIKGLLRYVVGDQTYSLPPVALSCNGWLTTIDVSLPANACTFGMTVTTTVSVTGFGQPRVSVTDKTYDVVDCGPATGSRLFEFSRLLVGNHLKSAPLIFPLN